MRRFALIILSVLFGVGVMSACANTTITVQVVMQSFNQQIFGDLTISGNLYSENAGDLTQAIDEIGEYLEDFDAAVSTKNERSPVYKFNKNIGGVALGEESNTWTRYTIGKDAYHMLSHAYELTALTDGYFDPTIYPVLETWGLGTGKWNDAEAHESLPKPTDVENAMMHCGLDKIRLIADNKQFYLAKNDPKVMVDFGAQAKGYAADRIKDILYKYPSVTSAAYSLSGNVYVFGDYPVTTQKGNLFYKVGSKPFRSGVVDPLNSFGLTLVGFDVPNTDGVSVVTSGDYVRRFYWVDGAYATEDTEIKENSIISYYSHIIDPLTGYPCNIEPTYICGENPYRNVTEGKIASATILNVSSPRADVYATAVMLMGMEKGIRWLEKHRLEAFLVGCDRTYASLMNGQVFTSEIVNGREQYVFTMENLTPRAGYSV